MKRKAGAKNETSRGRGAARMLVLFLLPVLCACDPVGKIREWLGLNETGREGATVEESATGVKAITAEGLARQNQELLAEMIRVIFDRDEPEDHSEYEALVRTLNQGASLEGIYRGIIMGSRYRALESSSQGASPSVLKAFAAEMAELQEGMREPTRFDPEEAKQVPRIDFPEDVMPGATPKASAAVPSETNGSKRLDKASNSTELLKIFVGASPFTLKRVLCEEALRRFEEAGDDPSAIPLWYAGLAVRLSAAHVDFGLEQRNNPDFGFHKNFAQKIAVDRVKWEVLNRLHRYLNEVNKRSG